MTHAKRQELAAVLVNRGPLTRQLAEAATRVATMADKLEQAGQEVIEVRMALAARIVSP